MISILRRAARSPLALAFAGAAFTMPAAAQEDAAPDFSFTQDYEPSPAIWRLTDEDTTIYMFGTIHLLPEGFRWRSERFDAVVAEAETLVVETSDGDSPAQLAAMSPKLQADYARARSISRALSPESRAVWQDFVGATGAPFAVIDSMPVMVALMSFAQGMPEDGSSYDYGVETVLEAEFAAAGKPIESIENFGHILYQMYRREEGPLLADLDAQLQAWSRKPSDPLYPIGEEGGTGDAYWAMEHAWARGEVQDSFDLGFGDGAIAQAFEEILLERRNRNWAEWLENRLDTPGTILLAVGAGHFEGDVSVLHFLEQRGLTAERID